MAEIKTVGVLTSGGDCAGLNAVIRAVTYHAMQVYGWKVIGIYDGTAGLIERPLRYRELTMETFDSPLLREGGTFLGTTSKGDPLHYPHARWLVSGSLARNSPKACASSASMR